MKPIAETVAFLAKQLADCENHWSLGTFGALAEFTRDAEESVALGHDESSLSAVTDRGGIRIVPPSELRLIASETVTSTSWNHRVALCLPAAPSAMSRRGMLTELGLDTAALRQQDRDAVLFDLGLDTWQVDACIRVHDPQVTDALRGHVGRNVFEHGNPAMSIIVPASPHRVFLSRLGRIEVYQPIPPPNGKSPEGPHTHVLPRLLQHKRTHPATEPIPDGLVPCAHLYPAHPIKDGLGRPLRFNPRRHDSFQQVLGRFGDPNAIALKRQVVAAVEQEDDPSVIAVPNDRFARANVRIALRQLQASREPPQMLTAWLQVHDRVHADSMEADDVTNAHE